MFEGSSQIRYVTLVMETRNNESLIEETPKNQQLSRLGFVS